MLTKNLTIFPLTGAGTSTDALSDSTNTSGCSAVTVSPSLTNHSLIFSTPNLAMYSCFSWCGLKMIWRSRRRRLRWSRVSFFNFFSFVRLGCLLVCSVAPAALQVQCWIGYCLRYRWWESHHLLDLIADLRLIAVIVPADVAGYFTEALSDS